jgi:NMD protein affecting ribosome stability and mRNA decay
MNKRFCPKCGSTDKPFVKSFCLDCFLEDHPDLVFLPPEIKVETCKHCAKIRVKGKFIEQSEENLINLVLSQLKISEVEEPKTTVELLPLEDGKTLAKVFVEGRLNGAPVELEKEAMLLAKTVLCDPCMRVSSQYHEGILQIRGDKKTPKERFEEQVLKVGAWLASEEKKDALARVTEIKWQKTGVDVLIGSKHATKLAAEKLAKEFGTKTVVSSKLLGQDKQGKEKHRFTYLVRIN